MADIDKLVVRVHTADASGAGTDGSVFLEIGGREFRIDSQEDDYERGVDRTYGLGSTVTGEIEVNYPERNDPQNQYPLTDNKIDNNPVWVRFEPEDEDDHWICQYVSVKARDHASSAIIRFYEALEPEDDLNIILMFGRATGKFLFLHRNPRGEDPHFP